MLTIEKAVEMYQIHRVRIEGSDRFFLDRSITENQEHLDFVRSHKAEIVDYLKEQEEIKKHEVEEQQAKLNALEGLRELEDAKDAWESYYYWYNRFIERGAEGKAPQKPEANLKELIQKYPRTNAYLNAEAFSFASNYHKAAIGRKAAKRILNGEDYQQVITDMEQEWKDYCNETVCDS